MTCPDCERYKESAKNWRHKAYELSGHPLPWQEPVGWIYEDDEGRMMFSQMPHPDPLWEPVYRAVQRRSWQGLTDEEIWDTEGYEETRLFYRFARALEAKLKAKNA